MASDQNFGYELAPTVHENSIIDFGKDWLVLTPRTPSIHPPPILSPPTLCVREILVFIGTCSVTTALVSAFTKER